jgi:hypothetical protein
MRGLKFNISLTFLLLLATGMLLVNVIITALWQRSLVNSRIEHSETVLRLVATGHLLQYPDFSENLVHILRETGGVCAGILKGNTFEPVPSAGCPQEKELFQVMNLCVTEGREKSICTGKTWGVLSTQRKYLYTAMPVSIGREDHIRALGIVYPLQNTWQTIRHDQKIILVYILVNTLVLTVIGFFRLASLIVKPIDRLVQEASDYSGRSNLGFLAAMEGSEFRQLSSAISRMVERIEADRVSLRETIDSLRQANEQIRNTQQEMVRAEKLASVGRLSAGLAHEIGNPLGVVQGYLGLLRQKKLSDKEKEEYIRRSEQELNRINTLVRQLLDFSRPLPASSEPVHVHGILADILQMLRAQKKNSTIDFAERLSAENETVMSNKEALRQAFMNFYLNAIDAVQESGHPDEGSIVTESRNIIGEKDKEFLQVVITDNGAGIAPEHLENIFDPFFTTKDPGRGTGLGLSVSYTILENMGGTVRVESTRGEGTSIIIELPVAEG